MLLPPQKYFPPRPYAHDVPEAGGIMASKMTHAMRVELADAIRDRYAAAANKDKSRILEGRDQRPDLRKPAAPGLWPQPARDAITLWNTRYLERAVATLRQTECIPDSLLAYLSPLGWEHVNLTGDYVWAAPNSMSENSDGLRPLRPAPEPYPQAA
jgi:hypothetical protein